MTRRTDEYRLHKAVLAHINSAFIGPQNPNLKVWHTPNQTRDATEAFFNKELGVLVGISDLLFSWPVETTLWQKIIGFLGFKPKLTCMGALELKGPDGVLSSAQNKFLSWAKLIGWHTGEARSVKGTHLLICLWGLKPAHHSITEPDYATKEEKFQRAYDWNAPQ